MFRSAGCYFWVWRLLLYNNVNTTRYRKESFEGKPKKANASCNNSNLFDIGAKQTSLNFLIYRTEKKHVYLKLFLMREKSMQNDELS